MSDGPAMQMRIWPLPADRRQLAFSAEIRPTRIRVEDLVVARRLEVPDDQAERFLVDLCAGHLLKSKRFAVDRGLAERKAAQATASLREQHPPNTGTNRVGTPKGW